MLEKLIEGAQRLGISLSAEQKGRFQVYYEELQEWNKRVNLTAIKEYEDVQLKHFLDSLTVLLAFKEMPWAGSRFALLDVGTGAGLPGIPLKIMLPEMDLVLLDSVGKKTAFLQHLVGRLGLERVEVLTGRAEEAAHELAFRERFEVVVSRGLGRLPTLAELTLPFCRIGGLFVAQKKRPIQDEINRAGTAVGLLGGRIREVMDIKVPPLEEHLLVVIEKVSSTPERYPRRTGVPAKRPL
ncbi:MAG: 16S rRNA (guanine(527)-N(7))-methyltransferase RsmG [Chloroflexi bacterium]|nr:16S rRNA (guanine(527)-N(7))-methyltransferase RsmG [Chloroflexota bacterium]